MATTIEKTREELYHSDVLYDYDRQEHYVLSKTSIVKNGYYNLTKSLIVKREYLNMNTNETPDDAYFRIASYGDQPRLVKLFLNRGVDVNHNGGFSLARAIDKNDLRFAEYLFSRGASLDRVDMSNHRDPLINAVGHSNFKMVRLILAHRHDIMLPRLTNLYYYLLSTNNNKRLIALILEHGPEFIQEYKYDLLGRLHNMKDIKAIRYVLNKLSPINEIDILGHEIIYYFNTSYHNFNPDIEFVKTLVEYGANVKNLGSDALIHLIAQGRYNSLNGTPTPSSVLGPMNENIYPIIDYLVSHGADLNAIKGHEIHGQISPLVIAIWTRSPKLVKHLLDLGANVNANDGLAIKRAALNIHNTTYGAQQYEIALSIIKLLIDYGAVMDLNSDEYRKAVYYKDQRLIQVFESYKKGDDERERLFYQAIANGDVETILETLRKSIIVNYNKLKTVNIQSQQVLDILNQYLRSQNEALYTSIKNNNIRAVKKLLLSGMNLDFNRIGQMGIMDLEMIDILNAHLRKQ
jgi:ankyrin repeat protein